jgi:predicted dehydrogenase
MVPGFRVAENAVLAAVASRTAEKAEQTATKHGIPQAYGSYDALLADETLDAVFIPLPNTQHAEWTERALRAGKHVLCDKPMAMTLAEAERVAALAEAQHLRLMEGFMYRHHPQHTPVWDALNTGTIGNLRHYRGVFTYTAAHDPGNIRWQPSLGGGALLDVGVYPVNGARWFFGEEPVAVTGSCVIAHGVDRQTSALLEFADGRTASILCGFDQAFCSQYELVGDRGRIVAERGFQVGEKGVRVMLYPDNDVPVVLAELPHVDQYAHEIAHFSACVLDPKKPLTPGENGVAQARIVEALRQSLAEKQRRAIFDV